MGHADRSRPAEPPDDSLPPTVDLLAQIRAGDSGARDSLIRAYLPILRRWARGRVPRSLRSALDTDDLVQVTFIRTLDKWKEFELERPGALLAYLRRTLVNLIRDELRKANVRPDPMPLDGAPEPPDGHALSPLEQAIGREVLERYEDALEELGEIQREAVVLRLELGMSYGEIAAAIDSPSANAARMQVVRGIVRLGELLDG